MSAIEDRARAIFLAALERAPDHWPAFVDEACGNNADLRTRVHQLLRAHQAMGSIHGGGADAPAATVDPPAGERPGTRVGPYKLLEAIGEGGMGAVWMAQQSEPVKRRVAVKLIKAGMDSRQVVARFEAERQALALMDHPNIAKVHDAGTAAYGRPFFVMELVKGVPLTTYCDEHKLTPRQRLELFVPVCHAIQHAHHKGVIHRDLKPSNVLVARYDDRPVVKVIDFGVAKAIGQQLTEQTLHTGFGAVVGTVEYMSPEQATFNALDIDTRSDVYALGVLLYELLTGTTPLEHRRVQQAGLLEALRLVREEEAPTLSSRLATTAELPAIAANRGLEPAKLTRLLRGELDWIVLRALEKDRNRRYETANSFAMDVQRYLADEPVQACPPSAGYRLRKFMRRNKRALAMAVVIGLAGLLVAGTLGWALRDREARQREAAKQEAARQEKLDEDVVRALEEAEKSYKRDKLPEARAAVHRAGQLLAAGKGNAGLQRRADQWQADLETVARLEEIRLEHWAGTNERADLEATDRAYHEELRAFGLDVGELDADEAAGRVRATAIRDRLVAALDDWVWVKRKLHLPGREQLLTMLQRADDDPWRDRFCQAFERGDHQALESLARNQQAPAQSPAMVVLLGTGLRWAGKAGLAVEVLWQAQRRHPDDFWINTSLAHALIELNAGRADEAAGFYRVAVAQRPQSPGVHLSLGVALDLQGKRLQTEAAEAEFREALRLRPGWAMAHYDLGTALLHQRKWPEAETHLREAVRLQPEYAQAHANLGNSLENQGKLAQAEAQYREALRLRPDDPAYAPMLGQFLSQQNKRAEAEAVYREALGRNPGFTKARLRLGYVLMMQGKRTEAEKQYREASERDPKESSGHIGLGNALSQQAKWAEAEAAYRNAVRFQPEDGEARARLGLFLAGRGRLAEAEAEYREAARLKPQEAAYHNWFGDVLQQQNKLAEAEFEFRQALRVDERFYNARASLAAVLVQQGKIQEAEAEHRKLVGLVGPKMTEAALHYSFANILCARGKFADALAYYRRAVELDPDDAAGYYHFGNGLRLLGKEAEAEVQYREAIRLQPKDTAARYGLASILSQRGKLAAAEDEYREVLRLKPDVAGHSLLGTVLLDQGRLPEAIAAFREALRINPDWLPALSGLCYAYGRSAQWDQAAAVCARAVELDPGNHWYWYQHAVLRLQVGDREGYRRACREMLARFGKTDQPEIAERLAKTCLLTPEAGGDPERVQELAERAFSGTQKSPSHGYFLLVKALADYRAGRLADAVERLRRAGPESGGANPDALAFAVLAMAQHRLGRAEEARAALAEARAILAKKHFDPGRWRASIGIWHDWLHAEVLSREAAALLDVKNSDKPARDKPGG
jgi:tetratricopeptide (TPR) repeat protein/serine/threonine protein kinase